MVISVRWLVGWLEVGIRHANESFMISEALSSKKHLPFIPSFIHSFTHPFIKKRSFTEDASLAYLALFSLSLSSFNLIIRCRQKSTQWFSQLEFGVHSWQNVNKGAVPCGKKYDHSSVSTTVDPRSNGPAFNKILPRIDTNSQSFQPVF